MRKLILSVTGIAFLGLLAVGCNSRGGGGSGPGDNQPFKIHGIFVRDANLTSTKDKAYFELTRNDTLFHLAALTIDTFKIDTTAFNTYYRQSPPDFLSPGQNNPVKMVYAPNNLNLTISHTMPDTFSLNFPGLISTHENPGGGPILVEWTASGNANGYLIACVNDSAGKDTSFFPGSFTTNANIPKEAFRTSTDQAVPGLYKVYVIAFRGGIYPFSGMPFPYPANYTPVDTTYSSIVGGRITAAYVSKFDTIRVTP